MLGIGDVIVKKFSRLSGRFIFMRPGTVAGSTPHGSVTLQCHGHGAKAWQESFQVWPAGQAPVVVVVQRPSSCLSVQLSKCAGELVVVFVLSGL